MDGAADDGAGAKCHAVGDDDGASTAVDTKPP